MSPGRWATLAALCCAVLTVAYLPPPPDTPPRASAVPPPPSPEERRLNLINRAYSSAAWRIDELRLVDSLRGVLRAAHPARPDAAVFVRGPLSPASQQLFRAAVESIWERTRAPGNGMRLIVLLDATRRHFQPAQVVLPSVLDGRTCVVLTKLEWDIEWLRDRAAARHGTPVQNWLQQRLGPCLYFAAFGAPGPQIADWLQRASYRFASNADWTRDPPTIALREQPEAFDQVTSMLSFDGLACSTGRAARCSRAIAASNPLGQTPPRVLRNIPGVVMYDYWSERLVYDNGYLAVLIRDFGRERFGAFWRSPAPLDSAFRTAFGQPIDQWTAGFAHATIPDLPPFGPTPRRSAIWFGLGLAGVALAGAALVASRRQVS